ncbi:MAG: alpha-2-macroglobulin family protein [candidate division Zixibacteria bacterium]|nr:alpha-2-macroglobulin family protein [candidate division Zixibacteria bacterium]
MNYFSRLGNKTHFVLLPFCLIAFIAIGISVDILADTEQTKPDENVTVLSFTPRGQINTKSNMTIVFSRNMVPEDSLNKTIKDHPIKITPYLSGIARWIDRNSIRFYPDKGFAPATSYKIKIESQDTYQYGNKINEEREFEVSTPPLMVSGVNSYQDNLDTPSGTTRMRIFINFNHDVNFHDIKKMISITGGKNASIKSPDYEIIDYSSSLTNAPSDSVRVWYAYELVLLSEPIKITEKSQDYVIHIKDGIPCYRCGDALRQKSTHRIRIDSMVRQYISSAGGSTSGKSGIIKIRCQNRVSADAAKEYISVYPEIPFTLDQYYNSLTLRGNFKPGEYYDVTIASGMPAENGSILKTEFSSRVKIPNLSPSITFNARGIFLPKEGNRLLELETVNIDKLSVEAEQVFANNLVYALGSNFNRTTNNYYSNLEQLGKTLFSEEIELNSETNKSLVSTIDIGSILSDTVLGIYKVHARSHTSRWVNDARLIMLTDIGISARLSNNYLMVWANSLSESKPIKKAIVSLYSKNNQLLVTGKTDSRGIAVFDNIVKDIDGFAPFLITVEKDNDLSYVRFAECRLPISEFDVKGRPFLSRGYEAMLYLDRGVYRPGDTAHIVSIVRDENGSTPSEFPYFIKIKDPTGREMASFRVVTSGDAVTSIDFPVPDFAQTGAYTTLAGIGDDLRLGTVSFQVEEFMPDRIKTTIATGADEYSPGETIKAEVSGMFLFGPPAKGHKVTGNITIESHEFRPAGFESYTFSNGDVQFSRTEKTFPAGNLDENGKYVFNYQIPKSFSSPSALKGLLSAGVSEQGGRAVFAYSEVLIHPYEKYIGLRLDFDGYAQPGKPVEFSAIAINHDGQKEAVDSIDITIYRVVHNSILRKDRNGNYRYKSEKTDIPVDSMTIAMPEGGIQQTFTPPQYGSYKIVVSDRKGRHSASRTFYASGWGYAPWSMEQPDRIEIDLDKDSYHQDDKAVIQIRAPFGGRLLLTVEKNKVLEFITYDMDGNTAEITIPVKKDFFPNAYITATIIKKAAEVDSKTPARAFGIAPININRAEHKLPITITAPEIIKPNTDISVSLDIKNGRYAKVTLSAVDVGILQLTDYQTPDPLKFFFGKRQPGLKIYDIYSFIFPEVERAKSHLTWGGGRSLFSSQRKRHVNPISARRVKSIALWSGIITCDEFGHAEVPFVIPEFNGKLRLSAVAVENNKFGSSSADIIVRDKIIIQESFPRFVTPGDKVNGHLTLFNNTGRDSDINVRVIAEGPIKFEDSEKRLTVAQNSEASVLFPFTAQISPGKIKLKFIATDGIDTSTVSIELPNRPAQPVTTKFGFGAITSDSSSSFTIPDEWVESTEQTVIKTSSLAAVGYMKNMSFLLRYPYGCLEQTTSKLMPLINFNDLSKFAEPGFYGTRGPDYFIREGIIKLDGMMRPDGWFSYWPGRNRINGWSSIYASHFIIEARQAGYQVNKGFYNHIIKSLREIALRKNTDSRYVGNVEQIYAAYALSKAEVHEKRILNSLKSIFIDDLPSYSRYQLAAVYHAYGDTEYAKTLLPETVFPETFEPETGGRFSSGVRTNAILLSVLIEISPESPSCAVLAKALSDDARVGRWYTTQETAWALMALGRYLKDREVPDFTGEITIENESPKSFTTDDLRLERNDISGKTIEISIIGTGPCYYFWQSSGVSTANAAAEFNRGIKVTRTYQSVNGEFVNLRHVPLGTQLICHIHAEATDKNLENVVINDLLPAGCEIENPRLKTTPRMSWVPKSSPHIDYQDIRDDRMLLFGDLKLGQPIDFYYSLRTIAAGEFILPPIAAECMYNPMISSISSSGIIIIRDEQ